MYFFREKEKLEKCQIMPQTGPKWPSKGVIWTYLGLGNKIKVIQKKVENLENFDFFETMEIFETMKMKTFILKNFVNQNWLKL